MNSIQFFNSTSSGSDKKASKPVVIQESLTIANGTGGVLQPLVDVPSGDCAGYGGQIVNKGCYDLQVTAKYLDGGDCDSCTVDTLTTTCVTFYVPANSVFPVPDGFFVKLLVGTVDSNKALVNNTTAVDVSLYSAHAPSCNGCVAAPASTPAFDGGRVTVQGGAGWSTEINGFPTGGVNVWLWNVDNNFNLSLNGQSIASVQEINMEEGKLQAYLDGGLTADDLIFSSDDAYIFGGFPYNYPSDAVDPLVKINISAAGAVTVTAWRNDAYEPVKFKNGATFRTLAPVTDECGTNAINFGQSNLEAPTNAQVRVFSA